MTPDTALLALLGLGFGLGLVLVLRGWRGGPASAESRARRPRRSSDLLQRRHAGRWLAAAGGAGLLAGLFTGWIVGGLLAAMAVWSLPRLLGSNKADQNEIARVEAIAGWTEMLRDTLSAAAGLEQAITATAPMAPEAIRPQIQALGAHLERGTRLKPALRAVADELDDPTADLVLAALLLASEHESGKLTTLLGELAATAREQVQMRQRVEAGRARARTTMRVVVITSLSFAGGLVLFNSTFLEPYDTVPGQLVLLVVGAIFTGSFSWLRRLARLDGPERFLVNEASQSPDEMRSARRETAPWS